LPNNDYTEVNWATLKDKQVMPNQKKPVIRENILGLGFNDIDGGGQIQIGTPAWINWLEAPDHSGFVYAGEAGHFSARREIRRGRNYWYAYRRREGKLTKIYLGKSEGLTAESLREASERLAGQITMDRLLNATQPAVNISMENIRKHQIIPHSGITSGFPSIPLSKIKFPVLPQNLIARPRLTSRITTPVTLILAPAGYGKTTLLNEWRLSSGLQVAWIGLNEEDNDLMRFWSAVVIALQTVSPNFGQTLLTMLRTSSSTNISKIIIELTNDIIRSSGESTVNQEIGIILDNFNLIDNPEVFSSLLFLLDYLPPNLKLVVASRKMPPLNLSDLRATGRIVELGVNDLRFTLEEGIEYLWQHILEQRLAYRDMEKLVNRCHGWITGLVLAVNALSPQENFSQFVATFTGAHPFLQDYFLTNVLDIQSPEVHQFLLKVSVLRHLSGPLCDAVTGQVGGASILATLAEEDLFLEEVESEHFPDLEWYSFHDFFKEMLLTLLHKQHPEQVIGLHHKAAKWFSSNNAPADAIYYLLISENWMEAAAMIEKVALRELSRFGGGARVLRWLQRLPEAVYQDHNKLLGLYARLASLVSPTSSVDSILERIEMKIGSVEISDRSREVQDSLNELQRFRNVRKSDFSTIINPPAEGGYESVTQILDGIQKYQNILREDIVEAERMAGEVYEAALSRSHLFGILMAGGACSNLALSRGQLRRSEQIAHQVLEQAYEINGSLPDSASIALTALSRVFYERNQLVQAHQLLVRATEVDPSPANMNELITIALLRAKIQSARGDYEASITTIQAVLDQLAHRPSNFWLRQDLISYQALFLHRQGNRSAAERLINESGDAAVRPYSKLTRAAILIDQERYVAAEDLIRGLLEQYPAGYYWLPTIRARVMLASALFNQHKINQARQVMAETASLAGPEFFVRPFFVSGTEIVSLLSLVLHTENLPPGIKSFLKGTLTMLGHADGVQEILPRREAEALKVAASITPREGEVLHLLCANLSNQEIAEQCSISSSTVKTHLENIYRKLGVNSRGEASAHARMLNLV
jgi:LuxR family maltose regulon positive regulatory protein